MTEMQLTAEYVGRLPFDQIETLAWRMWDSYRVRNVSDGWDIGMVLSILRAKMHHGEWMPYLDKIGMAQSWAFRLMRLHEGYPDKSYVTYDFMSVDDAVKALPPKRKKAEEQASRTESPGCGESSQASSSSSASPPAGGPEREAEAAEAAEREAAEAEAEREAEAEAAAEREAREERLAIRLADTDGDAVAVLSNKLDEAAVRHRDDVAAVRAAEKREAGFKRKLDRVRDALLTATPSTCLAIVDEILAAEFTVARKA